MPYDQPPATQTQGAVFYSCSNCGSLSGGIFGSGPTREYRSGEAHRCVHAWEELARESFIRLAYERFGVDWSKDVDFLESTDAATRQYGRRRTIVVRAELAYYVVGDPIWRSHWQLLSDWQPLQLLKAADTNQIFEVSGFIMTVQEPVAYAGQILTIHHDGVLSAGNPYELYELGKAYQLEVEKEDIGNFRFGPCSLRCYVGQL